MPLPNWAIITGACILPNVGGWVGGLITRSNIKSWYEGNNMAIWSILMFDMHTFYI